MPGTFLPASAPALARLYPLAHFFATRFNAVDEIASGGLRNPFEKGFLKNLPKTFAGQSPVGIQRAIVHS
jgi:hypothetical protein